MSETAAPPLAKRNDDPLLRSFVTPEGVDLRLRLAEASERAAAFVIDITLMAGLLSLISLVLVLAGMATSAPEFVGVVWLFGFFLLRTFYFTVFELGPRAATPGKRMLGIRVAPRHGGRLRAEAIFARNAMREAEVFMPLGFLFARGLDSVDGWIIAAGFLWSAIFAFFPLFNRDRLRPGDIVAGTWVVRAPKRRLAGDLAGAGEKALAERQFTAAELDAYGQHELHVLEDVLRAGNPRTMKLVADRIRAKIARPVAAGEDDVKFLEAYYTALRQRLETRLLLGVRRRDKHDKVWHDKV